MLAAVRNARDDEAGAIADLLSRAAFGPTVSRLVAFPRASPHGDVLVAENGADGGPAGAVCCVSFGPTGWIGALGVAPESRRHGLGRALTEAAVARLRERGASTVLLFATDMGRPLYERLGFVAEGAATAWRGTAGATAGSVTVRRLREDDRAAVAALDRIATGEDRSNLLDALHPLSGVAVDRAGALAGWAAKAPYGAGIAICAADEEAGATLMAAAAGGAAPATLVVPDANAAANANLRRWGFRAANAGERMRLGPPVAWRPERQFGLFNLFWG
jgi:ribosomal protein S18 acetylase RimI-like enzyme